MIGAALPRIPVAILTFLDISIRIIAQSVPIALLEGLQGMTREEIDNGDFTWPSQPLPNAFAYL